MNAFHDGLPFPEKLREHFHSFMQHIHAELKPLTEMTDPLQTVASNLAGRARVICLDEFHVSDIADAMLLGRVLGGLFKHGVTVVTTSNTAPDALYQDGLQRERFLPAIELIKRHLHVLHLPGETDFRLRALESAEIYHHPLDSAAETALMECFNGLTPEHVEEAQVLAILGREIQTVRCAEGIAWFEFEEICKSPRSTADYIELARYFHTMLIANVVTMGKSHSDEARRFIQLVDELYDRKVNLILSAAVPPDELYTGKRLAEPFKRTRSRLVEMQSREYLHRSHLP